jgi:hypothetical protein
MVYSREVQQITNAILKAGKGMEVTLKSPPPVDPFSGRPVGEGVDVPVNTVSVSYSREDIANQSLANGLTKLLLAPLYNGEFVEDLNKIVENKNSKVKFSDGREFYIRYSQTTSPNSDLLEPLLIRIFVGA